jgi:hypothetical protein
MEMIVLIVVDAVLLAGHAVVYGLQQKLDLQHAPPRTRVGDEQLPLHRPVKRRQAQVEKLGLDGKPDAAGLA